MNDQLPLPDPDAVPVPPAAEVQVEDLTPYRRFITHDTWQNRMKVHETALIAHFLRAVPYMEEIHRKQFQQVSERLEESSSSRLSKKFISRTVHHQVATIIKRYLPKIKEENVETATDLEEAVNEAAKIEKVAAQMVEEVSKTRGRGNVRFVDSIVPKKAL